MSMAVVSLLVLVGVILIAWKFKFNPGLIGFGAAFVLGFFVCDKNGVPLSSIKGGCKVLFAGFNTKLWIRIMMVSIFFAIGQCDGTLEVFTKKFVRLIRGRNKLLPIVFYVLTLVLAAIGAGSIGVLILLMPIAAAMAAEQKLDFMLTGLAVAFGGAVGGVSPLAATGIVGVSTAAEVGITVGNGIFTHYLVCGTLTMTVMYILLGGWKYPNSPVNDSEEYRFNGRQLKTLLAIMVFAVLAVMGYEIAFLAAAGVMILCVVERQIDQKKIIMMAPWSTLVLLGGMGILVKVVAAAGGITMMTDFFKQFMHGPVTGVFVTIISAIMSFVSSASGVVMPTLIPTVPALSSATGFSALGLINAITFGAHQTGISPFSTGGSLILSMGGEHIDQQSTFSRLIVTALGITLLACGYSYVGLLG